MKLHADLIEKINNSKRNQKTLLIGIDGFGGAGKSTLAKLLKGHFENVTIVEMDDFYQSALKRADYQRVDEQVLKLLVKDTPASYQRYDWKTDTMAEWHTIEPGGIVVVEGVYSTAKEMSDAYDLKIWVECSQEIGMERGIARDLTKDKVETRNKWINDWMPREKDYVDTQNPKKYADYIIDGQGD